MFLELFLCPRTFLDKTIAKTLLLKNLPFARQAHAGFNHRKPHLHCVPILRSFIEYVSRENKSFTIRVDGFMRPSALQVVQILDILRRRNQGNTCRKCLI